MCEHCSESPRPVDGLTTGPDGPDRRTLLTGMLAVPFAAALGTGTAGATGHLRSPHTLVSGRRAEPPPIIRRSEWGGDLLPKGPLPAEDVRFLLVHHTAEPGSDYGPDESVKLLRGIYAFHTGASKGWPDVAYNFFVDKYGKVFEGRTGSFNGPIRGSATGGNQGYSQLCCFLGDFNDTPPPAPALESMYSLLAWLADRYRVDTTPGAKVQFTSLGSNRWPAGSTIDAATISAHRDMSQTTCPGDACYALVRGAFPQQVSARRAPTAADTTVPPTAAPTTPAPTPTEVSTTAPTTTTSDNQARAEPRDRPAAEDATAATATNPPSRSGTAWPWIAGVAVIGAATAGGVMAARRRTVGAGAPADGSVVAWRTSGGVDDPLVHALATAARPVIAAGGDWWDEVASDWQVAVAVPSGGEGSGSTEPGSLLIACDGRRALIRLVGDATGEAVLADGSRHDLTPSGVTKVWLASTTVRLTLDGQVTEVSSDGVTGPVDRTGRTRR